MSDLTPGLPTTKTLVFVDNNGNRFTTTLEVNAGAPGAAGDPSGCLPLSGGTINGSLTVQNGQFTLNNTPLSLQGSSFYTDGFVMTGGNGGFLIGNSSNRGMVGVRSDSTGQLLSLYFAALSSQGWHEWDFGAGGTVTTPSGHTLIEATGSTGRPVTIQRFSVQAANGTYIPFPSSFSNDSVQIIIPPYFDGTNLIVSGTNRRHPADRNGFTLSKTYTGSNGTGWVGTTDTIDIIAIGEG